MNNIYLKSEINSKNGKNNDLLNEIINHLEAIIKYIRENLEMYQEKNDRINSEKEITNDEQKISAIKNNRLCENELLLNDIKAKSIAKELIFKQYLIEVIKKIESLIIKINNNNLSSIINNSLIGKKFIGLKINTFNLFIKNIENIAHIKNQETTFFDGKYIGQIVNGLRQGKGTMYYNNGDKYEGEWKDDKKYKGIHYFNEEPFKGDKYDGFFINDKFEGEGIYYWNDGDKYEGNWKNGKRDGKGIYYFNNKDKYVGYFSNDKHDCKGIYYFNDGDIYIGEFKNDKVEGQGIEFYTNGNKYEGYFIDGQAEGKGIYYYNDGDVYEGDFRNNKFEGKGVFYFKNGDREMGDYINNESVGKHVRLKKNGEVEIKNY